ncbi:MAG: hypothetical protein RSD18_00010 [Anaerovoracaceae bacterium]
MSVLNCKQLKDYTLGDVRRAVAIALKKRSHCYVLLDGVTENNAYMYLSENEIESKVVFGTVDGRVFLTQSMFCVIDFDDANPYKYYDSYGFSEKLFAHIDEEYGWRRRKENGENGR